MNERAIDPHHRHEHGNAHGREGPAIKVEQVPEGAIYTCPMHPQIRQVGPGNCPICGMALEPLLATAETGLTPTSSI